jgi:DNA-binding LytR/AlgR family response regulator
MRTALVDDLKDDIEGLRSILTAGKSQYGFKDSEIDAYASGEEFLEDFASGKYDLIFLDIFMEDMTGIDTARKVREIDDKVHIIFTTTSNGFASESYEVRADYYLLKPYTEENVAKMMSVLLPALTRTVNSIQLPDGSRIPTDSIIYAESRGHYAYLHLKNGRVYKTRLNYSDMENILCRFDSFISCFKGVIVNLKYVDDLADGNMIMRSGDRVPVSRRKAAEVKQALADYLFRSM